MERCRFLSKTDLCQIGQLALNNKLEPNSITAIVLGEVEEPKNAIVCTGFKTNIITGQDTIELFMTCTAANNVEEQNICDGFLPKKHSDPLKRIGNDLNFERKV